MQLQDREDFVKLTNLTKRNLTHYKYRSKLSTAKGHIGLNSAFQVACGRLILEIAICYFTDSHTRL